MQQLIQTLLSMKTNTCCKVSSLTGAMLESISLYRLAATALAVVVFTGCSHAQVPSELKMDQLRYDASIQHAFGPAGLNKGFKIYQLDESVANLVNSRGLKFLNTMPSAVGYQPVKSKPGFEGSIDRYSFIDWKKLPVQQEERWNYNSSYPKFDAKRPVLADYYGGQPNQVGVVPTTNFSETIKPAERDRFERIILGNEGYFSYGGFRNKELIVIDLDGNKIYHLYVR